MFHLQEESFFPFMKLILVMFGVAMVTALLSSCDTLAPKDTGPPKERLSSMPQNLPQSWEGQVAGFPGSY
jgi:hypothetical protein